jgi:hypothetical protein
LTDRKINQDRQSAPIWHGRPAVGSYVIIFGLMAIVATVILVTFEYAASSSSAIARALLPSSIKIGSTVVPYPFEIATSVIIVVIFLYKVLKLAIIRFTNTYDLLPDGLYINRGIINLENTLIAPVAFSDARLIRTFLLRIAGRGMIIVEANDGRRFYLKFVKNPSLTDS